MKNVALIVKARTLYRELQHVGFTAQQSALFLLQLLVLRMCEAAGLFLGTPMTYAVQTAAEDGETDLRQMLSDSFLALPQRFSTPVPHDIPANVCGYIADFISLIGWSIQFSSAAAALYEASVDDTELSEGGIYYTSTELIHKCIDDLFLNRLRSEAKNTRSIFSAYDLLDRIHSLTFLDASSGSGGFLCEIYRSLHEIELYLCKRLDITYRIGDINKYFGIEIDPNAAWMSRICMAIMCRSCEIEACSELGQPISLFELTMPTSIICADALSVGWHKNVDFLVGNPPYISRLSEEQAMTAEILDARMYDYCACWLIRTFEYIRSSIGTQAAYLLTASVCRGRSVEMWRRQKDISISFAYQPFPWSSASHQSADLSCVVVGLVHKRQETMPKPLHCENGAVLSCEHINCCLQPLPDPPVLTGTVPTDRPVLTRTHRSHIICSSSDDSSIRYLTAANLFSGDTEYTADFSEKEIYRAAEPAIVIPRHCSSSRRYIPLFYVEDLDFVTNESVLVCSGASMYLFALLSSAVHQDFIKTLCGRLDSSYRYSSDLYNSFPIIYSSEEQKVAEIIRLGKTVLETRRNIYSDTKTAVGDMYLTDNMPPELLRLHIRIDLLFDEIYFGKPVYRTLDRLKLLYELIQMEQNDI